jgi:thioredoxin reductase
MSIEVTLYSRKSTKNILTKFLLKNGFNRTRHVVEELNNNENIHFMWFGFENYQSSTGVEATVRKSSDEEKAEFKCADWILHTRTRSSGSFEDKQKQNEIIKEARRNYEGTFYNDWYG